MNSKQAEAASGVPRENIRFYEKQGLLAPARNPENDYREYGPEDIRALKLIRTLRMLDMPLEEIKQVLKGSRTLADAATAQQQRLTERAQNLQAAIEFCGELQTSTDTAQTLDVDACLARMAGQGAAPKTGYFTGWLKDYRALALAEHQKQFTFFPDGAVTTPAEFTEALFAYAREEKLDLVITKEGMCPEFTIDGVEYTARRNYTNCRGIPVAAVRCQVAHPEDFEPDCNSSPSRRRLQKLLYHGWPVVALSALILFFTGWGKDGRFGWLFESWGGWLIVASVVILVGCMVVRSYYFTYNENGRTNRRTPKK